jgi:Protein of unknown function (DUF1064)
MKTLLDTAMALLDERIAAAAPARRATLEHVRVQLLAEQARLQSPRRHKFNAMPTEVDGVRFDSKREARRWAELQLLERAGQIHHLERQVAYPLHAGAQQPIGAYVSDFSYVSAEGRLVVEDAKGIRTPLYRWKKKHLAAEYGIAIVEV